MDALTPQSILTVLMPARTVRTDTVGRAFTLALVCGTCLYSEIAEAAEAADSPRCLPRRSNGFGSDTGQLLRRKAKRYFLLSEGQKTPKTAW